MSTLSSQTIIISDTLHLPINISSSYHKAILHTPWLTVAMSRKFVAIAKISDAADIPISTNNQSGAADEEKVLLKRGYLLLLDLLTSMSSVLLKRSNLLLDQSTLSFVLERSNLLLDLTSSLMSSVLLKRENLLLELSTLISL